MTNLRCRGVAKNAYKSLCVINETLYYLSSEGIMSWDGSLPGKVSATLARDTTAKVTRAVGGQLDGRYYLYTENAGAAARLLVYDTERGLWHEEGPAGQEMASTGRQLYLYDGSAMWAVDPSRETDGSAEGMENALSFDWISGDIGLDNPDDKYVSRVTVRLDAQEKSQIAVLASYDAGPWVEIGAKYTATNGRESICRSFPFDTTPCVCECAEMDRLPCAAWPSPWPNRPAAWHRNHFEEV